MSTELCAEYLLNACSSIAERLSGMIWREQPVELDMGMACCFVLLQIHTRRRLGCRLEMFLDQYRLCCRMAKLDFLPPFCPPFQSSAFPIFVPFSFHFARFVHAHAASFHHLKGDEMVGTEADGSAHLAANHY
jgi:hypothetical protein